MPVTVTVIVVVVAVHVNAVISVLSKLHHTPVGLPANPCMIVNVVAVVLVTEPLFSVAYPRLWDRTKFVVGV